MSSLSPAPDSNPFDRRPPRSAAARPVMRAGTRRGSRVPAPSCDRCQQVATDPLQQILMSAQWLIPGPDGPRLARYCRACPPTGPITDLTCTRCGDGPLLTGDLATGPTGDIPSPARQWLTANGWCLDSQVCPDCRPGHQI